MYMDYNTAWGGMCGNTITDSLQARTKCLMAGINSSISHLLGGEIAIWTERIDHTRLLCRTFPRALAIAWRYWSHPGSFTPSKATCTGYDGVFSGLRRMQQRMDLYNLGGEPVTKPEDPGFCAMLPKEQSTDMV